MKVESAEHDPSPQHDSEVDLSEVSIQTQRKTQIHPAASYLSHQSPLLLRRPRKLGIEPVPVFIIRLLIHATPVRSHGRVRKGMVLCRPKRLVFTFRNFACYRRLLGREDGFLVGNSSFLAILWRWHHAVRHGGEIKLAAELDVVSRKKPWFKLPNLSQKQRAFASYILATSRQTLPLCRGIYYTIRGCR